MLLGLDTVTISLIVAISGTALYEIRVNYHKFSPKILDGLIVSVGGSFAAAYAVLSQISQADQHLQVLTILGLIGGTIPAGALSQKAIQKAKSKNKKPVITNTISKHTIPQLSPNGSWYQNNFTKTQKGNSLQYGQIYLWVRIKDVRSYVSIMLKNADGMALQVEQSHKYDEDNNIETVRLELLKPDGMPFPKGVYHVMIRGDRGTGDSQGIANDTFEIV